MTVATNIIAPEFAQKYIQLVSQEEVNKALEENTRLFLKFLQKIPRKKRDFAYAEGKWTLREMLQHIIDAERVFTLRAVWFARKDSSPLPGFDENVWAANVDASLRKWSDMTEEFKGLRKSTRSLFKAFTKEELWTIGIANNNPTNVIALGYMCSGHVMHHMNITKERYL